MKLRPAQEKILKYKKGEMAISAVPGSGKTFTLSMLAANLITEGEIDLGLGQQVLVVTYMNSSVDAFRTTIGRRLSDLGVPLEGFDVRTLHSLALEIVRTAESGYYETDEVTVAHEAQRRRFLGSAVDSWIGANNELWQEFLPVESPQMRVRWRETTERSATAFIRAAKNGRYQPADVLHRISHELSQSEGLESGSNAYGAASDYGSDMSLLLAWMMAGIYQRYQSILKRHGTLDFDDLIWLATDLLEKRLDLSAALRKRWPYILEDEAQDSVPLQELLLTALKGPGGNWVRVGDPNQAITSTFTAAHPRYFSRFIQRPGVLSLTLPNSGRCAPLIFGAANRILQWVCDQHPVPEVRQNTFYRQEILPTPPGDAQPNPSDEESKMLIRVYSHREDEELPAVARLAMSHAAKYPMHTLAILVPTNDTGQSLAELLDRLGADYDNLLRGGSREREIAASLQALLAVLADPTNNRSLVSAYSALHTLGHPAAKLDLNDNADGMGTLLRSVYRPERLLFPENSQRLADAIPPNIATEAELERLAQFATFLRRIFDLRPMALDDMVLALSDELFAGIENDDFSSSEADLATAHRLAYLVRQWRDLQPQWRLPEIVSQLADLAEGRSQIPNTGLSDLGFEPEAGRVTLITQHRSKGLEWDAVFLVGIDGFWIPSDLEAQFMGSLDFLGGDLTAEVVAQLHELMEFDDRLYPDRTATDSAHIEVISERLRLLYVGITRARSHLYISRSRRTRQYSKEREANPTSVLGVLYEYLKDYETRRTV